MCEIKVKLELCFSHLFGIAAKISDVLLDPLHGQMLVPKAHVPGIFLCTEGKEPEQTESVVEGHQNLKWYAFSLTYIGSSEKVALRCPPT